MLLFIINQQSLGSFSNKYETQLLSLKLSFEATQLPTPRSISGQDTL